MPSQCSAELLFSNPSFFSTFLCLATTWRFNDLHYDSSNPAKIIVASGSVISPMTPVFITGGTGYMGRRLIKKLVVLGYSITALVRPGSENKLRKGVKAITANPFDASQFKDNIPQGAVIVQLLGVAHPSPRKKEQFRCIDLASVKASADAAALVATTAGALLWYCQACTVLAAESKSPVARNYWPNHTNPFAYHCFRITASTPY